MPHPHDDLFSAHHARVYRWACAMGATHEQALDTVQDVFLRRLSASTPHPRDAAVIPWLRKAAASSLVDRWRSDQSRTRREHTRRESAPREPLDPSESAAQAEAATHVRAAVRTLSDMQRLVLTAKTCDGLTFREIAAELDIAEPTAKTHYLRALHHMHERLAALGLSGSAP